MRVVAATMLNLAWVVPTCIVAGAPAAVTALLAVGALVFGAIAA